jgi:16S rRNA (uracil1498-N3)-methyltransferase
MPHFESHFVPPERIVGEEVHFPLEEVRHLATVLRRRAGDVVWAVDGKGRAYETSLVLVTRREVRGRILRMVRGLGEPETSVTLAAGVLKGERFDWLVEKAVELGASRIAPFTGGGSAARSAGPARAERWRKVALAAMKQCGRSALPEILPVAGLDRALEASAGAGLKLAAHPGSGSLSLSEAVRSLPGPAGEAALAVGPEGGFTDQDLDALRRAGFVFTDLGTRRLRSETAALVLLSAALARSRA